MKRKAQDSDDRFRFYIRSFGRNNGVDHFLSAGVEGLENKTDKRPVMANHSHWDVKRLFLDIVWCFKIRPVHLYHEHTFIHSDHGTGGFEKKIRLTRAKG